MSTTTTYRVDGMSCGHCVRAVTEAVEAIDGTGTVEVDLDSGSVTVASARPLDDEEVRTAIDQAGYRLA